MPLTDKQKKYIKKQIKKGRNINQIAKAINVEVKIISEFLGVKYEPEKNKKKMRFSFKLWLIKNKWQIAALVLLILVAYFNSLDNQFLSDDIAGILENKNIGNFRAIIKNPFSFFHLLVRFLVFHIFGKNPTAFRATILLFHSASAILIYLLISMTINAATGFIAASLFAVHPLLCESVVWVSAGYSSFASFFILLSLIAYVLSENKKGYYWLSVFAYLLGLASSEKAIAFPLVIAIFQLTKGKLKKDWPKLIPFFGFSILWGMNLMGAFASRKQSLQKNFYQQLPEINTAGEFIKRSFFLSVIAVSSYISLAFWPDKLTLYHSEMFFTPINFALRIIVVFGLLSAIIYSFFKNKTIFFWLCFFLIMLLPTMTPFGVSWIVAERYVYIAAIGLFVVLAYLIDQLNKIKSIKNIPSIILFALIIPSLMIRTIIRNRDWQNQDTLWLAAAKTSPNSSQNHNNLGDYYGRNKQFDKAIEEFSRAIELNPNYADAYHNLANIYVQTNQIDKAIENYQKALSINPDIWQSHQNLAMLFFERGQYQEAKDHLASALKIDPNNPQFYINLAIISAQIGEKEKAEEYLQKGLQIDPDNEKILQMMKQL